MAQSKFKISRKKYFGKLLLFGEYGIILNSMGLAIPFRKFSGGFNIPEENSAFQNKSNEIIKCLADFAIEKKIGKFNETKFSEEFSKGIYFNSNIPQGYGAGSSGALVAAFYERYFEQKSGRDEMKKELGSLEDFFHGKSSGYDPLVSYLNKPIIIHQDKTFEELNIDIHDSNIQIFLIDTGFERKTKGFVNNFMNDLKDENYRQKFEQRYIEPTNNAIEAFVQGNNDAFFKSVKEISKYQFENWSDLIPENLKAIFEKSLEEEEFSMKFCGAGGGGYFLGFTEDQRNIKSLIEENAIQIIEI